MQTRFGNRPNVIGIRAGSGGGKGILLNAHMDTVENGDPAAWTQGPLSGAVVDGRLYGRGSCDMKGGLATFVAALRALGELGVELREDVTVAATVGEENGGVGWAHSADEHMVIDDLLTASRTIACLLVDWCGAAERHSRKLPRYPVTSRELERGFRGAGPSGPVAVGSSRSARSLWGGGPASSRREVRPGRPRWCVAGLQALPAGCGSGTGGRPRLAARVALRRGRGRPGTGGSGCESDIRTAGRWGSASTLRA